MTRHFHRFARPLLIALGMTLLTACSATSTATKATIKRVNDRPSAHALESLPLSPLAETVAERHQATAQPSLHSASTAMRAPRLVRLPARVRAVRDCWRCGR